MNIFDIPRKIKAGLDSFNKELDEAGRRRRVYCASEGMQVVWRRDDEGVTRCQQKDCPDQNEADVGGVPIRRGVYVTMRGRGIAEVCDSALHRKPEEEDKTVIGHGENSLQFYPPIKRN